ncbi:MAG: CHASE2 domain-containing protein [Candidatus Hydrogenedentota bacterium]|nr:MAG: CHASE2 domain-containing protein [Candidatus Hydrogenedentota bacterium]
MLLILWDPGGMVAEWERRTLDARYRFAAAPTEKTTSIVIVDIDEESIKSLEPTFGRWPWPREVHGMLARYLARKGARVTAFDVIFSERVRRANLGEEELRELRRRITKIPRTGREPVEEFLDRIDPTRGDRILVSATADASPVIHSCIFYVTEAEFRRNPALQAEPAEMNHYRKILKPERILLPEGFAPPRFHNVTLPFEELSDAAWAVGHTNYTPDPDGPCRRAFPLLRLGDEPYGYPSLSVLAAAAALGITPEKIRAEPGRVLLGDRAIPVDRKGGMLIHYQGGRMVGAKRGGAGYLRNFKSFYKYIPFDVVLLQMQEEAASRKGPLPEDVFRDKVVLIGSTAAGLMDLRATPFSAITPGVEIHANVIDSILARRFLRALPDPYPAVLVVGAGLVAALLAFRFSPWWGTAVIVILGALYSVLAWFLFTRDLVFPVAAPEAAWFFSFGAGMVGRVVREMREKHRVRNLFGRYLSSAVLEEVLKYPEALRLEAQRREITVLFSDITGFTSLSEDIPPEEISALLNEYLTRMVDCVLATDGILDKFIGDAVVAEWNAPRHQEDHAVRACRTALMMIEELGRLNREWEAQKKPMLSVRIGINTGDMVVGDMGSDKIVDYTVIGNEVNTGARLEPLNKMFGTVILVSRKTRDAVEERESGRFFFRFLGRIRLVGRHLPLEVFELCGERARIPEEQRKAFATFGEALEEFRRGRIEEAVERFEEVLRIWPDDGPARFYRDYALRLRKTGLPEGWDGVVEQISK